jgi:hypothetical protein
MIEEERAEREKTKTAIVVIVGLAVHQTCI